MKSPIDVGSDTFTHSTQGGLTGPAKLSSDNLNDNEVTLDNMGKIDRCLNKTIGELCEQFLECAWSFA